MKILKSVTRSDGRRIVTVEIGSFEVRHGYQLQLVLNDTYYRLGGQLDDVVPSHVITDMHPVTWCHIEQKWVD